MRCFQKFLFILLFIPLLLKGEMSCTPYGCIDFSSSVASEYHALFIKGVVQLHNFLYEEAQKTFLELQKLQPDFVLAYWGEAMTYNHPLWDEVDPSAGREALAKLAKTPEGRVAKATSEQEKGFIRAVNKLYGEGDKKTRDRAYLLELKKLYEELPEDNEVATFYALALLGNEQGNRNFTSYMQAASICEDVFFRNREHPGAIHYLIHSVDDPIHAPLGLQAAYTYSRIAPGASHAAHMPSHIYFALGMWEDSISSNQRAWESGQKRIQTEHLSFYGYNVHDLHALQWLHYSYLQAGQFDEAHQLLEEMYLMTKEVSTPLFKWYYAHMRAAHIVTTIQWDAPSLPMEGVELSAIAVNFFANATMKLLQHESIDEDVEKFKTILAQEEKRHFNRVEPGNDYFTSTHDDGIAVGKIVLLQVEALKYAREGAQEEVFRYLNEAIKIEDKLPIGYGPPMPPKPSKELLGEFYMKQGKKNEACSLFKELLEKMPHRYITELRSRQLNKMHFVCKQEENLFFSRFFALSPIQNNRQAPISPFKKEKFKEESSQTPDFLDF